MYIGNHHVHVPNVLARVCFALFILGVIFTLSEAWAQDPNDVKYFPSAGVYTLRAQAASDTDMAQVCFERVWADPNTPNEVLGCVPAGPNQIVELQVEVRVTPKIDANIKGFAFDTSGNKSDPSPNTGLIDFTPPGRVRFQ